ncbi:AAA family ATPase [Kribbella italica]|uniref:Putative kinase n=1 Tax=Kribbella italica TaxID=1540520 RepID=A0A7W9J9X6_9ACTN|nr:AAA family ATPase [Kribbella italica]MBB5837867.1 putative kinase [Kribbella italica]
MPDLIILRGNSASGKSTLALELQRALGPGTANVGQDHLRRVILREHDVPDGDNITFIADAVRSCLRLGYTTILEGILYSPHYGTMLRRLLAEHPGTTHVFYLDVPLDETLRRHELKPMTVPASKLREWYHRLDLLGVEGEITVDGSPGLPEVLAVLLDGIGPVTAPQQALDPDRFV